jgi:transcription antitermination factor NusG
VRTDELSFFYFLLEVHCAALRTQRWMMPILAAEQSLFPCDLLDGPPDPARHWWAVYTRPRQEKALARELARFEIPFYLPLVPRSNVIRGQEVVSYLPLFAGYVFLCGSPEERLRSLATKRIAQTIVVEQVDRFLNDLRNIRHLIEIGAPLTIESQLARGRRVRVKSGAMRGLEGRVLERRGQTRLLVSIDFLQQGASMAIEDYLLEPLD